MKREIAVGTRVSKLAMWQARWVVDRLKELCPGCSFRIVGIRTLGDRILDAALVKIGDKGLFTKELEAAMLRGEIDMAVHSMKDLPTELPEGLVIGAVCKREHPADVLVSRRGKKLDELPGGALVGTSSLRRCAQLLWYRDDLRMVNLRGNINTRLRKLEEENLDAAVLAYAGLFRMGRQDAITQVIPFDICLPAVGQGSIGVEVRSDDGEVLELVKKIDHRESRLAVFAERAFLRRLEGGCQVPVGALGTVENDRLRLEGVVATPDGKQLVRSFVEGNGGDAAAIGLRLAEKLLELGAGEILKRARQEERRE
ncbi:MAG: hydroxymethylbilane synthase [Pelotomaculum sp.]|uniref:Porphobilinogen deaminase n=1 Tax=Pelotomaculum thermopropionicum (strain DSM 13744 / JCM 10971 / SI) TaxID=370438 RepID=HEM3_PELTS|nr:RecName: Full=Porphobilinogen deaminase; Short=PBG; AltName: Full=Hydroxymethylbilane synthase; Short=HMBS; AltName: Full=Pre-uroporphyrinogen synthase [Pelotomaculum thermopropionicum SI]NPV73382.1 hydroxymethylbilane synthase [Pelotomaculum sp.]BAF59153.1 porphobilinogen deaminase [Pelotomaculum thermopropionicum SI]